MKKKKRIFRSGFGLLLCLLLFGLCFSGTVSAQEEAPKKSHFPTGGIAKPVEADPMQKLSAADVEQLNRKMASYTPSDTSLLVNEAPVFYFYEQLEPLEQEMYDIMLMIANDPVEDNIGIMMTDRDPSSDEFFASFVKAYYAMTYDHPELFWLYYCTEDSIGFYSDVVVRNGIYYVYFQLEHTYDQYETRMTEFNKAANEFLLGIDQNASDFDIVRQIHDKLISMVSYNYPVLEKQANDLAHTAYGALVQDSSGHPNQPVCDGYSLAFEYLLQQCGLEAVYIGGIAGEDQFSAGGHAWSMVKIDGSWFEVDSTWDDSWNDNLTADTNPYAVEMLNDYTFKWKLEHYLFLLSTDHITDYNADENYFTYYTKDGLYWYSFKPDSVHIRDSNKGGAVVFSTTERAVNDLMDLAPVAMYDYVFNW